jgi:hypothetical protein
MVAPLETMVVEATIRILIQIDARKELFMNKILMIMAILIMAVVNIWADVLWDGRSRGIVVSNQFFTAAGWSGTFNTTNNASPTVGSNYYPDAEGANPYFSAASSITNYLGRVVPNIIGKDCIYQQSTPVATTNFKSMVLWDWAGGPLDLLGLEVGAVGKSASIRFVLEKGSDYFVSQIIATVSSTWTLIGGSVDAMTWYDFQPFVGGISAIGDATPEEFSLSGITGVGYYADAVNSTPVTTLGTRVSYFHAAVPEPATALLMAIGGGLACLLRLKQWS